MTSNGQELAHDDTLDEGWDTEPPAPALSRAPLSSADLDSSPLDAEWDSLEPPAKTKATAPPKFSSAKERKLWERKQRAQRAKEHEAKEQQQRQRKAEQRAKTFAAPRLVKAKNEKNEKSTKATPAKPVGQSATRRTVEQKKRAVVRPPPPELVDLKDDEPESSVRSLAARLPTPNKLDTSTLIGIGVIVLIVVVSAWFVSQH